MKMITPNKKAKKGFSLIEMLVVIAIIAILVAIIIPVVHNSTVKAAAATNAANLRAIEGKLKIMRLENPEAFLTVLNLINDNEAVSEVVGIFGWLNDLWNGTGSTETSLNKLYGEFTAVDGVLNINRPGNVYVEGVPTSQAVKVTGSKKFDSVNVEKGTEMVIHITDGDLKATYGGYGVNHFADIAEDGKLNESTIENPGNASNALQCLLGHDFGPDGICRKCGYDSGYHACVDEYTVIQNIFNPDNPIKYGGADGKCDICGLEMHTTHVDNDNDHFCDYSDGFRLTECDEEGTYDKDYHYCSVCGKNAQPHRYSGGSCVACGRPEHLAPEDCVDTQGQDHACDICGTDGITECSDGPDDYHDCDKCGEPDISDCADNDKDHFCDQNCGQTFGGVCTAGNGTYIQYTEGRTKYHTLCQYCGEGKGACIDGGADKGTGDHKCDTCGNPTSTCTKDSEKCDVCGQGEDPDCITPDTLIALADGASVRVDELTGDEMLLVWNHETGAFDTAPVAYIIDHGKTVRTCEVIRLVFSNGKEVKIVGEHVFFDATENKYVPITSEDAESFIGHTFVSMTEDRSGLEHMTLVAVERSMQETEVYDITSYKHLTCFTNDVLSACAYIDGLLNNFEINPETLAYDQEKMDADIEKYGLLNYAFLAPFISRDTFEMHNCSTLTISLAKGNITLAEIFDLIELYYTYTK